MTAATSVKHGTHAALSALGSAGTTVVYDANKRSISSQFSTDGHAEFLAMVLHELRNPLSAILSGVSCARHNRVVSPDLEWIWSSLERASERVRALAGDLTQLCHSAHPAFELRHRPVNLSSLVRSILESRRDIIEHSTIKVGLRIPDEVIWVNGDALRLQIALENLLDNALKYTAAGGDITVSVISSGEDAILRFRDSGRGISPEVLPNVFKPFVRDENAEIVTKEGSGLGLVLVQRLIELHGGRVEAFSDGEGHGSEFVIWLPKAGCCIQGVTSSNDHGSQFHDPVHHS